MDLDAAALWICQARLGLEERGIDRLRRERGFDDMRRGLERRLDVAAAEFRGRLDHVGRRPEGVRRMHQQRAWLERFERIGDRLEHLVVDFDLRRGLPRVELRVGHDHREEIADAAGRLADGDKQRQVGNGEARATLAGHIARREDPLDSGSST